jgi:hypothetical protein
MGSLYCIGCILLDGYDSSGDDLKGISLIRGLRIWILTVDHIGEKMSFCKI